MYKLKEVKNYLNNHFVSDPSISPILESQEINFISKKENFKSFIQNLAQNRTILDQIASKSYRHDNNFDKLVLVTSKEPEYRLRLHIWWPENSGYSIQPELIHNHRWNFSSFIILGAMTFETFQVTTHGSPHFKYVYIPPVDTKSYQMKHNGTEFLSSILQVNMTPGCKYAFESIGLHRVTNQGEVPVVSLMIRGASTQKDALVYSEKRIEYESAIPVTRLAPDQVKLKLERIMDFL